MVHSVCTTTGAEQLAYVQRMSETLFASGAAVEDRLQRLFATETDEFDLEHAFFSHVDTDAETQRFDVVHGARGDLTPDNTVPLSTSYCRETIAARDGTLTVSDALAEGWGDDPAYERFDLGSYLGTTVTVGDDLYGTLCYANTAPRPTPSRTRRRVSWNCRAAGWASCWSGRRPHPRTVPAPARSRRGTRRRDGSTRR